MIVDLEHHLFLKEQTENGSSQSGKICERYWDENGKLRIRIFQEGSSVDKYLQFMDEAGLQMPPVVITECYWPEGYRGKNPYSDMAWYLSELAKDEYVLGMAWFTLGPYSFGGGQDVNVVKQLPAFARALGCK
jgi:hypothetical protein